MVYSRTAFNIISFVIFAGVGGVVLKIRHYDYFHYSCCRLVKVVNQSYWWIQGMTAIPFHSLRSPPGSPQMNVSYKLLSFLVILIYHSSFAWSTVVPLHRCHFWTTLYMIFLSKAHYQFPSDNFVSKSLVCWQHNISFRRWEVTVVLLYNTSVKRSTAPRPGQTGWFWIWANALGWQSNLHFTTINVDGSVQAIYVSHNKMEHRRGMMVIEKYIKRYWGVSRMRGRHRFIEAIRKTACLRALYRWRHLRFGWVGRRDIPWRDGAQFVLQNISCRLAAPSSPGQWRMVRSSYFAVPIGFINLTGLPLQTKTISDSQWRSCIPWMHTRRAATGCWTTFGKMNDAHG